MHHRELQNFNCLRKYAQKHLKLIRALNLLTLTEILLFVTRELEMTTGTTGEGTKRDDSRNRQDHIGLVPHVRSKISRMVLARDDKCLQRHVHKYDGPAAKRTYFCPLRGGLRKGHHVSHGVSGMHALRCDRGEPLVGDLRPVLGLSRRMGPGWEHCYATGWQGQTKRLSHFHAPRPSEE